MRNQTSSYIERVTACNYQRNVMEVKLFEVTSDVKEEYQWVYNTTKSTSVQELKKYDMSGTLLQLKTKLCVITGLGEVYMEYTGFVWPKSSAPNLDSSLSKVINKVIQRPSKNITDRKLKQCHSTQQQLNVPHQITRRSPDLGLLKFHNPLRSQ